MKLKCVTVTGADNSVKPDDLVEISRQYPFVEFGILLSKSNEGNPRFPDKFWLSNLKVVSKDLKLSGHICGQWIRDLLYGRFTFAEERPDLMMVFQRLQLNFSPYDLGYKFLDYLKPYPHIQFIFQFGKKKHPIPEIMAQAAEQRINAACLFDRSGGKGLVPKDWPAPIGFCGYAGGLGPDTLQEQLPLIAEIVGNREIWVDFESRVRTEDNLHFDLYKVVACLEICKSWV